MRKSLNPSRFNTLASALLLGCAALAEASMPAAEAPPEDPAEPPEITELLVTKTSDSLDGACNADCSLREAVVLANNTHGKTRIYLARAGIYRLTILTEREPWDEERDFNGDIHDEDYNLDGDLDVTGELEIIGINPERTVLDADRNDRVIEARPGSMLTLRNLALINGRTSSNGGALINHGDATLWNTRFQNNFAFAVFPDAHGGAIANFGTLRMHRSVIQGNGTNTYQGASFGAGIYNFGNLILRDSELQQNSANGGGSGPRGGALFNHGTADIARTALTNNSTGGLGGAIGNEGQAYLQITNSTISGNRSGFHGGAIDNGGAVRGVSNQAHGNPKLLLSNVTIAGNEGYGLKNAGHVRLRNSIIAGNGDALGLAHMNCQTIGEQATYEARGLLLGSSSYPSDCRADLYIDSAITFSKLLYPLAANNARNQSHALRKGSLAVDAGVGSCTQYDQRGFRRQRDGDGDGVVGCDLGAYERAKP